MQSPIKGEASPSKGSKEGGGGLADDVASKKRPLEGGETSPKKKRFAVEDSKKGNSKEGKDIKVTALKKKKGEGGSAMSGGEKDGKPRLDRAAKSAPKEKKVGGMSM